RLPSRSVLVHVPGSLHRDPLRVRDTMEGPGQTTQTARVHIDVEVWRGSIAESRHRIQAAVVDASGMLRVATEQPERVTSFRSAAKPFQLLPLVEGGLAERWDFSEEQLAVMAASHTGSPHHIAL